MSRTHPLLFVCATWIAVLLSSAAPGLARAPLSFKLDDQFERTHTAMSLFKSGRPIIFLGGDQRESRAAITRWLAPLRKTFGVRVHVMGYLDLQEVPFFVPKSLVRRGLKKNLSRLPVLCDFKGLLAHKLGFLPKTLIQVQIFDGSGRTLGGVRGAYSASRLAQVRHVLHGRR
ncbi:MAG: hypothetical protein JRH20_09665 [Deltaproteobacteria bacterium]|nr:hypothetical protein [Deltaproteobacteria bacterium]